MRRLAPFSFVPWLACLAAQTPTGPSLPRLLQLGPVPGNATTLELRADGSLARRSGGTVDLAELDRIFANTTPAAELVLAIDRNTACAVVASVLDLARSKNVPRVHFAATLPDGQAGCFTLALPEGKESPTTIDLRLHRDRPGVPAESCIPLLQRMRRGATNAAAPAFVLGIDVQGDEPFESLVQALGTVARAECDRIVIRCRRTTAQQQVDATTELAALAAATQVLVPRSMALDLGPSPALQVPPQALPQPRPAVRTVAFGCGARAAGEGSAQRAGGAGGRYGGRAGGAGRQKAMAEAIAEGNNWYRNLQRADGSFADDAGAPDLEGSSLLLLSLLGDGSTLDAGPFHGVLRAGTGWLFGQQRHDGRFADAGPRSTRTHALTTYALAEASGLSPNGDLLRGSVQDALGWLFAQRQPDGGWNDGTPGAESDTISTACSLAAIASAGFFGVELQTQPAELLTWFDKVAEPSGAHRLTPSTPKNAPVDAAATAAALFSRFFAGQDPKVEPIMKAAADQLLATADLQDPWCCYWTTYALYQVGREHWAAWQKRLHEAVVRTQIRAGEQKGFWEPAGGCSRLTTTALNVLTLEAYYRYSRLVR